MVECIAAEGNQRTSVVEAMCPPDAAHRPVD